MKKFNIKNWLRGLALGSLIGLGSLFPRVSNAGLIDGKVYDAWNGQTSDSTEVSSWINDGSSGIQYSKVPEFSEPGEWYVISGNFSWEPKAGDTIKMSGSLAIGPKTYTTHMDRVHPGISSNVILPTAFLEDPDKAVKAHAFGVWHVTDTSNANDTLKAEGWLNKNPNQKIPFWNYYLDNKDIDTSDIYPQLYLNLEKQDSLWIPTDSTTVRLWKTVGDTTWEFDTTFSLDTLKYGGATMLEEIVFPERMYINDTTSPTISNATEWPSDSTYKGPFDVSYDRDDESNIAADSLTYKVNQGAEKRIPADSIVGDRAYCTIDTVVAPDDSVHYKFKTVDASANANIAYWPGQDEWYSFYVKSIGAEERKEKDLEFKVEPNISRSRFSIIGTNKFSLYNVAGRKERTYKTNATRIHDFDVPSGIHYVKAEDGCNKGKTEKIIVIK